MKIELEEPFKSKWKYGYLRTSNENRKILDLYLNDNTRTTISYARYLKSVQLGYEITEEYEVDHIDDDKTNDDVNNLQILTGEQNRQKKNDKYFEEKKIHKGYHCAYCELPFILTEREVKMRLAQNVEMAFCSRSCANNYHALRGTTNNLLSNEISEENKLKIKSLRQQNLSVYKISELTGFARNTIMKYW